MSKRINAAGLLAVAGLAGSAAAQVAPMPSHEVPWKRDSGRVAAPAGAGASVVYETTVFIPNASWLRMAFSTVELSGRVEEGTGAYLRITSLQDGGVQYLNAESARQWSNSSAYFNGDAAHVELIAYAGTGPSRLAIRSVTAGDADPGGADSLCGADDRVLSFDNRQARHSVGCTSWLINDTNNQFLTAGHCGTVAGNVMSFNVPLSTAGGSIVQSAPVDQYPVDGPSIQTNNGGSGVGDDFCYFGVTPNSNTGKMPVQAYGAGAYTLMLPPPIVAGQVVRITGYGSTSSPVSPTWYLVQKTHTGGRSNPVRGVVATAVAYTVDTTGGNSGSPVILESSGGVAIGIHTHGYCQFSPDFTNYGTGLNHAGAQNALNNPLSVCRSGRGTPTGTVFAIGDAVNNFGTTSTTTGQFAKVAVAPPRMEGLAYNPNTGLFFAVNNDPGSGPPAPAVLKLWTINPATGAATFVVNLTGSPGVINGLGYWASANVLYGVVQATGTRVVINTVSGAVTVDGTANAGTVIGGAEFREADGMLYGIDDSAAASKLVRFTPATGGVVLVGALGAGIADCNGLALADDGNFYTINATTEQLLRVNPATGAATVVGATLGVFGANSGMSAIIGGGTPPCYANCDASTTVPILNVADFSCFLNRFAAGESYANCDGSTTPPVLTVADFGCFLNAFAAGCS